jgi:ankyrin repeat protein
MIGLASSWMVLVALLVCGLQPISATVVELNGERGLGKMLTPLMIASQKNDLSKVRELLAYGAQVNERTDSGETALYEAIEWPDPKHDNLPIVDALLQGGADPNEPSILNATPLDLSLTRDHANPAVTLRLLRAGSKVPKGCNGEDGSLSLATQDSSLEVMSALLSAGESPDCQNEYGMTALHWAAINGQADRVRILIDGGAQRNLRNRDGKTPLDLANTTNPDKRVRDEFSKTRALLESRKIGQS